MEEYLNNLRVSISSHNDKDLIALLEDPIFKAHPNLCLDGAGLQWHAVKHHYLKAIPLLITGKADVNGVNIAGQTCLHYATYHNHSALMQLQFENNADPAVADCLGLSPQLYGIYNSSSSTVSKLLTSFPAEDGLDVTPGCVREDMCLKYVNIQDCDYILECTSAAKLTSMYVNIPKHVLTAENVVKLPVLPAGGRLYGGTPLFEGEKIVCPVATSQAGTRLIIKMMGLPVKSVISPMMQSAVPNKPISPLLAHNTSNTMEVPGDGLVLTPTGSPRKLKRVRVELGPSTPSRSLGNFSDTSLSSPELSNSAKECLLPEVGNVSPPMISISPHLRGSIDTGDPIQLTHSPQLRHILNPASKSSSLTQVVNTAGSLEHLPEVLTVPQWSLLTGNRYVSRCVFARYPFQFFVPFLAQTDNRIAIRDVLLGLRQYRPPDQVIQLESTLLFACIAQNALESLQVLLSLNVSPNAKQPSNGWTPLHIACLKNSGTATKLLLQCGAYPRALCNKGETPMALATKQHSTDSQKELELFVNSRYKK